jgi:hypothetical protein
LRRGERSTNAVAALLIDFHFADIGIIKKHVDPFADSR